MTPIAIPHEFWEQHVEGVLVAWLADEGDMVDAGDAIAEIMVEKAQYEVAAPAAGRLRRLIEIDATVRRGDVIAELL